MAVWLVAAGCVDVGQDKDIRVAHLSALAEAQVSIAPGSDGQLHATFDFPGGAYVKTCTVLGSDVQATWGGVPVTTISPGSVGAPGMDACVLPDLTLPAVDASLRTLDALVDLKLFDGANELHMVSVGPLAPRQLVPDGGKLVDGTTAVLRWTSSTDYWLSVNAKDGGDGIMIECDDPTTQYGDPVFSATTVDGPYWTPLHVDGDVFSFQAIAERPYTGTMPCKLSAIAYAQLARCDFATCEDEIALPRNGLEYYLFELQR